MRNKDKMSTSAQLQDRVCFPFVCSSSGRRGEALLTHSNEFDIQSMKINLPKVRWFLHS